MSTTLADARASRIPSLINKCPEHVQVRDYTNKAQRMALNRGRWWRTYQTIQLCVTDGCLTWPRQVAHVEKLSVCDTPIPVKNSWWETLENSAGRRPGDGCGELVSVPRGTSPMFADISGANKVLRVYPAHSTDVGKRILFAGEDANGIWIRTQETPGVWIDGFYLTLAFPYVDSPMTVRAITNVQKDLTNELVRVYEHDTVTGIDKALAIYEPSETNPNYVRGFLSPLTGGDCSSCSCITSVTALVKLAFIPAISDLDLLLIGNIDALELIVQSIKMKEANNFAEAGLCMKSAIAELNHELRTNTGDKTSVQVSAFGTAWFGRVMGGFR